MQLCLKTLVKKIIGLLKSNVYIGRSPGNVDCRSIILFPYVATALNCGLTGIVYFKKNIDPNTDVDISTIKDLVQKINAGTLSSDVFQTSSINDKYLGGQLSIDTLFAEARKLKHIEPFYVIFTKTDLQRQLKDISSQLKTLLQTELEIFYDRIGFLPADDVTVITKRIDTLKDIIWCIENELITNIEQITSLNPAVTLTTLNPSTLSILKNINTVLNSIDRLEVRGRDSAGLSLLFIIENEAFESFQKQIARSELADEFSTRTNWEVLKNRSITKSGEIKPDRNHVTVAVTYKVAAEIGSLGDNVKYLRQQIHDDRILELLITQPYVNHTVSSHTRWASVGEINEANCHPLDNKTSSHEVKDGGIIHVCLNGDIDNFRKLKENYETQQIVYSEEISCDTKIIPVHIEYYLNQGHSIDQAFRLAVNDFHGSHAISMHTDLAPGKFFLALKGSGQAIFIGLAEDHYMPTSEIYGLVEETSAYIKLDGEVVHQGVSGESTSGQIFILDQDSNGGLDGMTAMFYDGTAIKLDDSNIRHTPLTSRDIDRQDFDHYFLKEISESPSSLRKTLENRWKIIDDGEQRYAITLDTTVVSQQLEAALKNNHIKRIIFIGQGTAGVAAHSCADIMRYYLSNSAIQIVSLKSSELSGFMLDSDDNNHMNDTVLIPISQSGTTTDTNRTVDMAKKRGAMSIAIVNRRDSDLSFKVDGVFYTSSGRDIEMSVASTKAFYSQIIAGAVLGLYFSQLTNRRNSAFISNEVKQMIDLPSHMEKVLSMSDRIKESANLHAISRTYWAAVGSGPNKAAADEIRIKLSELCYKTISSDYVEDKKHIDLSSEPLIFVCAAGTRRTVINDIIKDTAIFRSHKALPIVIADENEDRFEPYAKDVIYVPAISEHFAPILNTLVGHIWGYYAALTINEGSRFLYDFRKDIQDTIDGYAEDKLDIFEIALEKKFQEKIIKFYNEFRKRQDENKISSIIGIKEASNLTLLLKYLAGKLPVSDFELDFGIKGTAKNMFIRFFESLGEAINSLARPVDAIKHQAKTVTVGTSRIEEKVEGIVFDLIIEKGFHIDQLTISNILVLKNIQKIIGDIKGTTLYHIENVNLLGEPTDDTSIKVVEKSGTSSGINSRSESEKRLKGTKKIIVRRGNVYIGKGRKDNRSMLVIPFISGDPLRPNIIENLLLLDITFKESVELETKVKALGGKHEHIKNLVQENNILWEDKFLELIAMDELFGRSAEKISESIIVQLS